MNDIFLLVNKIEDQLLEPLDLHLFAHEWKVVVKVMEAAGYVHLQEVALTLALDQLTDAPLELF